jgi:hypothetical protein
MAPTIAIHVSLSVFMAAVHHEAPQLRRDVVLWPAGEAYREDYAFGVHAHG